MRLESHSTYTHLLSQFPSKEDVIESAWGATSAVCTTVYDHLPSKQRLYKAALSTATTAVAVEALSRIPGVDGGPFTYGLCIFGCSFAAPPALPFCLAACAIGLVPACP